MTNTFSSSSSSLSPPPIPISRNRRSSDSFLYIKKTTIYESQQEPLFEQQQEQRRPAMWAKSDSFNQTSQSSVYQSTTIGGQLRGRSNSVSTEPIQKWIPKPAKSSSVVRPSADANVPNHCDNENHFVKRSYSSADQSNHSIRQKASSMNGPPPMKRTQPQNRRHGSISISHLISRHRRASPEELISFLDTIQSNAASMSPRSVIDHLQVSAKLQSETPGLKDACTTLAQRLFSCFEPVNTPASAFRQAENARLTSKDVALAAWSLGRLELSDEVQLMKLLTLMMLGTIRNSSELHNSGTNDRLMSSGQKPPRNTEGLPRSNGVVLYSSNSTTSGPNCIDMSNVLWGCSRIQFPERKLLLSFIEEAVKRLDQFDAHSLASLFVAVATLKLRGTVLTPDASPLQRRADIPQSCRSPTSTKRAIATTLYDKLDGFDTRRLCNFYWSCGKLGWKQTRILNKVVELLLDRLEEMTPQHISNVWWASAQLEFKHDRFLQALSAHLLTPVDSSVSTGDACNQNRYRQQSGRRCHPPNRELGWNHSAPSSQRHPQRRLVTRATQQNTQGVANIFWAMGRLMINNDLADHLAEELLMNSRQRSLLLPQHVANIAWFCGRVGFSNPQLLHLIANETVSKMSQFNPQNLANVFWGLGKAGFNPSMSDLLPVPPTVTSVVTTLLEKLTHFESQAVSNMLLGCVYLGWNHPVVVQALIKRAQQLYLPLAYHISHEANGDGSDVEEGDQNSDGFGVCSHQEVKLGSSSLILRCTSSTNTSNVTEEFTVREAEHTENEETKAQHYNKTDDCSEDGFRSQESILGMTAIRADRTSYAKCINRHRRASWGPVRSAKTIRGSKESQKRLSFSEEVYDNGTGQCSSDDARLSPLRQRKRGGATIDGQHIANCIWGIGSLQRHLHASAGDKDRIGHHSFRLFSIFACLLMSERVDTFIRSPLGSSPPSLTSSVALPGERFINVPLQQLSLVLWGFASIRMRHDTLFRAILNEVDRRLAECENVLRSCKSVLESSAGNPPQGDQRPQVLASYLSTSALLADSVPALCQVVWALGRVFYHHWSLTERCIRLLLMDLMVWRRQQPSGSKSQEKSHPTNDNKSWFWNNATLQNASNLIWGVTVLVFAGSDQELRQLGAVHVRGGESTSVDGDDEFDPSHLDPNAYLPEVEHVSDSQMRLLEDSLVRLCLGAIEVFLNDTVNLDAPRWKLLKVQRDGFEVDKTETRRIPSKDRSDNERTIIDHRDAGQLFHAMLASKYILEARLNGYCEKGMKEARCPEIDGHDCLDDDDTSDEVASGAPVTLPLGSDVPLTPLTVTPSATQRSHHHRRQSLILQLNQVTNIIEWLKPQLVFSNAHVSETHLRVMSTLAAVISGRYSTSGSEACANNHTNSSSASCLSPLKLVPSGFTCSISEEEMSTEMLSCDIVIRIFQQGSPRADPKKVAVEIDGPWHYIRIISDSEELSPLSPGLYNPTARRIGREFEGFVQEASLDPFKRRNRVPVDALTSQGFYLCLDGRTRLKQRLFSVAGTTLVNLPFYELTEKRQMGEYLQDKLKFVFDELQY